MTLPKENRKDNMFLCIILAAMIPAAISGFLANYFLEERFELKCGKDLDNEEIICTSDGKQCCNIISSFDIADSYNFIGGLFSNMLAVFALIRILACLMI